MQDLQKKKGMYDAHDLWLIDLVSQGAICMCLLTVYINLHV